MQIQLNTDSHIKGGEQLAREVEDVIQNTLGGFGNRIMRVEVHLADQNSSQKSGDDDIRCSVEARLAGLQPIMVTADAATPRQAVDGAADTLEKTLRRTLGRRDDPKGRTSFAGDQPIE